MCLHAQEMHAEGGAEASSLEVPVMPIERRSGNREKRGEKADEGGQLHVQFKI